MNHIHFELIVFVGQLEVAQVPVVLVVVIGVGMGGEVDPSHWHSSHIVFDARFRVIVFHHIQSQLLRQSLEIETTGVSERTAEANDLLIGLTVVHIKSESFSTTAAELKFGLLEPIA